MEELFEKIHLDKTNSKNLKKNPKKAEALVEVIKEAGVAENGCDHGTGALLYHLGMKLPLAAAPHRAHLSRLVGGGQLNSVPKLDAAMEYAKGCGKTKELDSAELEEKCGVGVEVGAEEVREGVAAAVSSMEERLVEERYSLFGQLMEQVRSYPRMQWADGKMVKAEVDRALLDLLGPRDERDQKKKKKKKEKQKKGAGKKSGSGEKPAEERVYSLKKLIGRDLIDAHNTPEMLAKHQEVTGGKLTTRFPPEPNGYLHIGHVKSINLNFGLAEETGGRCILRYDDTNPATEEMEFIDSIRENVEWLGFKPADITHSSDYFDQLYDLAVELIRRGLAYVCHQTAEEMSRYREEKKESPWRNRTVDENLREFERMRLGLYGEGEATLRMKGDMTHANPNMRDHVAYRIKFHPHPRTGERYCVYPTYDYTHCLVDSLEHVDYSLCTLEFEIRRESYYWLLDRLDLYKPNVWEFSRLNITNTVLSKRKLNLLVRQGTVRGYDDPRLLTIAGLRRRGYPPAALNAFCREIGVTRTHNVIDIRLLEHHCRKELDRSAPRRMVVQRPLRVVITNFDEAQVGATASAQDFPALKDKSTTRQVPTSGVIYIEESDFRMEDERNYRGLAPGKAVGLKYVPMNIVCEEAVRDETSGEVVELRVRADYERSTPVQQHVHWVPESAPEAELRLYDLLFTHENPGALKDKWQTCINTDSEVVVPHARVEPSLQDAKVEDRFQFERVGYFVKDQDSSADRSVFNLVVSLRESYAKK